MSQLKKICQGMAFVAVATTLLTGCQQVMKTGGNATLGFVEKKIVPPLLSMNDTDALCDTGKVLAPVILSTQSLHADPTNLGVLMAVLSGTCAEQRANNAELRYLRASKNNLITEAQDARIEQKRYSAIASERQYAGYKLLATKFEKTYKKPLGDHCPSNQTGKDELVYLLGMIIGLQAVMNDINSGGVVGVPKDIAPVVERGMACLDNTRFWGTPNATRATIWTILPGSGDGKPDPWVTLKQSTQIAEKGGVRLAHALYALAAQANGDDAKIRDAIKTFANARSDIKPVNQEFALIDSISKAAVMGVSDRYWTEHTGTRTPENGMEQFWDEEEAIDESLLSIE